jgi:hypothetical protein
MRGEGDTGKGWTRARGQEGEGKRVRADRGSAAATTGYCGVGSGGKDGGCAAAMAAVRTVARAMARATRRQQQQQDQGQR